MFLFFCSWLVREFRFGVSDVGRVKWQRAGGAKPLETQIRQGRYAQYCSLLSIQ